MINFIKKEENYFLTLGHDFISNTPKRCIPINREEAIEIANMFNEELAIAVGNSEAQWSKNDLKLTNAPEHPFGWTDLKRKRCILHYQQQSWHMLVSEIAEIGRIAKQILGANV